MRPIAKGEILSAFNSLGKKTGHTLMVHGEDSVQIDEAFEQVNAVKKTMLGNAVLCLMNQ